ncbi:hypothetical protein [Streptomyces sp. CB03911]|uniref:hypothetical protein n=1 Tax=Streptomyces sp. CB03911 TaxID=1804758 RepID=UPI0018FE20E1|nr:hypothetical protein [Streptomyces sp. CB03911]
MNVLDASSLSGTARAALSQYETAIAGIPDCFDHLNGKSLAEIAAYATSLNPATTIAAEVDKFVRGHLDMLSTWRDALDGLDSELRCHVVAGGLPEDQALYLQLQALGLFEATTALQCAAIEFHHGSAGPRLDSAYGHAYALSNSTLSPFR